MILKTFLTVYMTVCIMYYSYNKTLGNFDSHRAYCDYEEEVEDISKLLYGHSTRSTSVLLNY